MVERAEPMRTVIVTAFVDNDVKAEFPTEQGVLAVRAKVFGFERFSKTIVSLEGCRADFAL